MLELDYTLPNFNSLYMHAMNSIHYEVDSTTLKSELIIYARTIGMEYEAAQAPINLITVEGGIAYCINRGAKLAPSSIERVRKFLTACSDSDAADEIPEWDNLPETSKGKMVLAYVDCYSLIDNAKAMVLNGKMERADLTNYVRLVINERSLNRPSIVKQLHQHYSELLTEAKLTAAIKTWVKPLTTIVDTLSMIFNMRLSTTLSVNKSKLRKSTTVKSDRNGEKAASHVTYQDVDDKLGIVSINPANIIGANIAVIFNTKVRHCEVYIAKENEKLSIHGMHITNFNPACSFGKTIRDPDATLPHWTRATTRKRLEILNTNTRGKTWTPTGALNQNTLIIKTL